MPERKDFKQTTKNLPVRDSFLIQTDASVLFMNLQKKLRLLLRSFFSWLKVEIQGWLKVADFALA